MNLPAWAQNAENAKAQMRFGTEMAQRGLWNEALFRFEKASVLEPDRAEVFNNLAVAYEALGLFDEALENYRKGLRLAPTDKGLKRNYARFVEFYQRFRPEDDGAAESSAGEASDDVAEPPSGAAAPPEVLEDPLATIEGAGVTREGQRFSALAGAPNRFNGLQRRQPGSRLARPGEMGSPEEFWPLPLGSDATQRPIERLDLGGAS
jgi:tetratricopeptide (TPR) repeat protein